MMEVLVHPYRAAQLRAELGLAAPDALQAATALLGGADGFISNDRVFQRLDTLKVLILDDLRGTPWRPL